MVRLQEHQQYVLDYVMQNKSRGILLFHGTGTGKTLTAVSIATAMAWYKDVVILAPKSLHDNFRKELGKYTNNDETQLKRYKFVSSNASNMVNKLETQTDDITGIDMKTLTLDNKLVIIDEFHNLSVAMSNGSKNASALYDMIMRSKNCKLVFLTATAIINNPYELIIGLNLIKGYIKGDDNQRLTLFPEDQSTFEKYFLDEKTFKLKNVNKLKNRMMGLISYQGDYFKHEIEDFYKDMKKTIKIQNYPDRLPIKIELVPMSDLQYSAYLLAREKERLETRQAIGGGATIEELKKLKKDGGFINGGAITKTSKFSKSTSYRIKSRQISNIYYPESSVNIFEQMKIYSPKLVQVYKNLNKDYKTIIYSNFVKAGIDAVGSYLQIRGYKEWSPNITYEDNILYYARYTGDVATDDRTTILEEYNKLNSKLMIILISSSGAEGLSTKHTRHVHILESFWNISRIEQVIARAVRFHSHSDLPKDQQNVQVYIYLASYPKDLKPKDVIEPMPTDVKIFSDAIKKYELNQQLVKIAASVAIDCTEFNKMNNVTCYKCDNNGKPLFINDLASDLQTSSPCGDEKEITANEFIYDGNIYYVDNEDNIFQKEDNSIVKINDPDVLELLLSKLKTTRIDI